MKYLRYQVEPFAGPDDEILEACHTELDELGSLLGARNDLNNLRKTLRKKDLPALAAAIESRDRALAASMPSLSETVFRLETSDFVFRVSRDLGV